MRCILVKNSFLKYSIKIIKDPQMRLGLSISLILIFVRGVSETF